MATLAAAALAGGLGRAGSPPGGAGTAAAGEGRLAALERETLPGGNGLVQLAEHEAASGRPQAAVDVLLSGSSTGLAGARRLARAAELLAETESLEEEASQADQLLEQAIELAATEEALEPGGGAAAVATEAAAGGWWGWSPSPSATGTADGTVG